MYPNFKEFSLKFCTLLNVLLTYIRSLIPHQALLPDFPILYTLLSMHDCKAVNGARDEATPDHDLAVMNSGRNMR